MQGRQRHLQVSLGREGLSMVLPQAKMVLLTMTTSWPQRKTHRSNQPRTAPREGATASAAYAWTGKSSQPHQTLPGGSLCFEMDVCIRAILYTNLVPSFQASCYSSLRRRQQEEQDCLSAYYINVHRCHSWKLTLAGLKAHCIGVFQANTAPPE